MTCENARDMRLTLATSVDWKIFRDQRPKNGLIGKHLSAEIWSRSRVWVIRVLDSCPKRKSMVCINSLIIGQPRFLRLLLLMKYFFVKMELTGKNYRFKNLKDII